MTVFLAGVDSIVVGKDIAEGLAETSSRSQRKSSGIGHNLSARAASTGGACRLVAQRSIRMPHCVYLGVDEGLRVYCPWPLGSRIFVVVEADNGGEQKVLVRAFIGSRFPLPHQSVSIFPKEKR